MLQFVLATALLIYTQLLSAEPWLANRFAQNCAACHAPGRQNVPSSERRCTMTCQGCHVNPNGGGLRSFYGKWNENRWLKSFVLEGRANTKSTASHKQQHYAKPSTEVYRPRSFYKNGLPLVETEESHPDEAAYDRDDSGGDRAIITDRNEFLRSIPEEDPYRQKFLSKVDGGGEIRTMIVKPLTGEIRALKRFIMSADFGIRYRPVFDTYHLVYEARINGSPSAPVIDELVGEASTRSLYVMVDDLPYNSVVTAGYYRPLFGYIVPDDTAMNQQMIANALTGARSAENLVFKALSVGLAPSPSFFTLHVIQKRLAVDFQDHTEDVSGVAVNTGLRFATMGASVTYSGWLTTSRELRDREIKVQMHAITAGAQLWRMTANIEALSVVREDPLESRRQGGIVSVDTQTRLFDEHYATMVYARANSQLNGDPGSANQMKVGIRSFVIAGVDIMVAYNRDEILSEVPDSAGLSRRLSRYISGSLHGFF